MELFISALLPFVLTIFTNIHETTSNEFLRVCYFASWTNHRESSYARFDIKDIDPSLCTHIIYAFAKIDVSSKLMVATEPLVEDSRPGYTGRYKQFTNLKRKHSHLKTLLSIGGEYAGNDGFKAITENDVILQRFAKNTAEFLKKRNFDGLDVDWEYPVKETRMDFVNLLKALRREFDAHNLIITVAGAAGKGTIDAGYDVPNIARFVDFVNLMTYDYHGIWGGRAAFNSPLYSRKDQRFNAHLSMNWTVHYWMDRGLPASKAVVGVTGVGKRYVLSNENETSVGSYVTSELKAGSFYGISGGLAYPEICLMLASIPTTRYFDYEQQVPYLVMGEEWVGYDDPESLKGKVEWMLKLGVSGIMVWSLDQDDFTGQVCDKGRYPLLTAINEAVGADVNKEVSKDVNKNINFITKKEGDGGASTLVACLPLLLSMVALLLLAH